MSRAGRTVLATAGIALALLPIAFAAWFAAAGAVAWLPAHLAAQGISAVAGDVKEVEISRREVGYRAVVEGPYRPGGAQRAEVRVDVRAAAYTFGIAVFMALAFAGRGWRRPGRLVLGIAIMLVLPAFSIAADALLQIGRSPEVGVLLGWSAGTREAIAFSYQVGSLLLPTLGPIAAWLALFGEAWRGRVSSR